MLNIQSNTQQGAVSFNSGEDLTGKEGYLATLVDGGSIAELLLPTAVGQLSLYVIDEGGAEDKESTVIPLVTGEDRRFMAKGTGSAGAVLVHADPSTPADKGKVRTVPATEGVYFSPGVAEEDFLDGQLIRTRVLPRLVFVGSAFSGATPANTATTQTSPWGFSTQAQGDAVVATVRELRAWALANGFKS